MPLNLPILLTWLRIVFIPVLVLTFYCLPSPWAGPVSCLMFTMAGVTDAFDGYLARRWGQTSKFGEFLDPVADKLMVGIALVLLVQHDGRPLLAIPAAVIIGREITVSALREWMAELGARGTVAVSNVAKVKTIAQMVAIGFLLFREDVWPFPLLGLGVYDVGVVLLIAAAALTLWTMVAYLRAAWPALTRA